MALIFFQNPVSMTAYSVTSQYCKDTLDLFNQNNLVAKITDSKFFKYESINGKYLGLNGVLGNYLVSTSSSPSSGYPVYAQNYVLCTEEDNEFLFFSDEDASKSKNVIIFCTDYFTKELLPLNGNTSTTQSDYSEHCSLLKGNTIKGTLDKIYLENLYVERNNSSRMSNLYISNNEGITGQKFQQGDNTYYCVYKNIYCKYNEKPIYIVGNYNSSGV